MNIFSKWGRRATRSLGVSWAALSLVFVSFQGQAQPVGEVEFANGVGFAQTQNQTPRTLGKGLVLQQGDRLTTAEGGVAILKLQDGSRMTLRPNSEILIQQYQFRENSADNSMVMQLLRGGFRAITGLIAKGSPDAAKVVTKTATLGIRGTDFDARLCTTDCKNDASKVPERPRPNAVLASAKLFSVQGEISAIDPDGARRRLVVGGSIYPGDAVETGPTSQAVLVFRDESRMTLGANSRFRIENFVFDQQNPAEGRFLVSLAKGSMRALTGLIGKANVRNVGFTTATATLGIRGTGLDIDCPQTTACSFFTWLGAIEVTPTGQTASQVLNAGEGLFVSPTETRSIQQSTLLFLTRPDGITVDIVQLFGYGVVDEGLTGLFVYVRDGHIQVSTTLQTLHLGRGETGFAGSDGTTVRPSLTPLFMEFDATPMPNSSNPLLISTLGDVGVRANQCR